MKSFTDLLDFPFVFTQRELLSEKKFLEAYKKRVLYLELKISKETLRSLHQKNIWLPVCGQFKLESGERKYFDLRFIDSLRKTVGIEYLYSPYQLLLIPFIRRFLITKKEDAEIELLKQREFNDELINVLSIIEPIYYPDINGSHYHLTFRGDPNPIFDYMEIFSPSETLQWLGWTPSKIKHLADTLLMQVGNFDPLIKWHSLTQFIYPNKLDELRGDALLAVDYKIAAEMLLRFYEDLVELKIANPLPSIPPLGPSIYQKRLNPTHRILDKLDSVLMDFGISPHPSLIIVLEGQSEMEIVPKVMKILGIPYPSPFIKLFCIKGIDNESPKQKNKFQILAEYVALPELKNDGVHKFLSFTKPPVNFWVLTDAESLFESEQKREGEKKKWIDGLFDNLPKAYRISQVREILEKQVVIKSWDDEIFEFAHYSDQEIAQAILDLFLDYSNPPKSPSLDDVIGEVKKRRNNVQGRNLEKVLTKWLRDNEGELPNQVRGWELSKVALANKLWPVLEKKIRDAQGDATKLSKIPVARLLLEAEKTWAQTHRDNVVIPFNE